MDSENDILPRSISTNMTYVALFELAVLNITLHYKSSGDLVLQRRATTQPAVIPVGNAAAAHLYHATNFRTQDAIVRKSLPNGALFNDTKSTAIFHLNDLAWFFRSLSATPCRGIAQSGPSPAVCTCAASE